jgi:hypothetical protein
MTTWVQRKKHIMSANRQSGAVPASHVHTHPAHAHDEQLRRSQRIARAVRRRAGARQPSGIILLVVLVLLALFTMLLISFVVATVANRQSVLQSTRVEQTGDSPQGQIHDVFMQVVRGPRDSNSVIGPHSLLEDIYGHNSGQATPSQYGVRGQIMSGSSAPAYSKGIGYLTIQDSSQAGNPAVPVPYLPDSTTGAQNVTNGSSPPVPDNSTYSHTPILAFKATVNNDPYYPNGNDLPPYGYYAGRAITMLGGPAAGRTGRIVGYYYNNTITPAAHYFQVVGLDGAVPDPGDWFLINGRPFSGTGFGFRPQSFTTDHTRLLDACLPSTHYPAPKHNLLNLSDQPGFQYALLPNARRGVFEASPSYLDPAGPGGANEDYDAPDFQNMLLAMRVWVPTTTGGSLQTPLPSLHRPDLLMYWNDRWKTNSSLGNGNYLFPTSAVTPPPGAIYDALTYATPNNNYFMARNLLRKISLRPLSIQDVPATIVDESENPFFTGSNPGFDLINGPWDVDNDGDGVPDSIWVDVGFPVQTASDGRRYKPLAAILCVDMDGKLNLNAHSNVRHTPPTLGAAHNRFEPVAAPFSVAGTSPLKVGSGYGPAEISLHPLFEPGVTTTGGNPLQPTGELFNLLFGYTRSSPTNAPYTLPPSQWVEGRYGEIELGAQLNIPPAAGITWIDDPLNWMREMNLPPIRSWMTTTTPYPFSQRQSPYLPIQISHSAPQMPWPLAIDSTMWTTGGLGQWQWQKGYGSAYGTPPDLDGDGMISVDLRGQPMYLDYPATFSLSNAGDAGWGEADESIDDAYELNLSLNAANDGYSQSTGAPNFTPNGLNGVNYIVSVDAPFTPAELERILRWHDADAAALPDRLIRLAPIAFTNPTPSLPSDAVGRWPYYPEIGQMPSLLTTHSYDLPVPSMLFTAPDQEFLLKNYRQNTGAVPPMANSHIGQLVASRIRGDQGNNTYNADLAISQLLAPELIAGEKMNINRPLGNGYDDNGNGVIDEPGETESGWSALAPGGVPMTPSTGYAFDLDNDGAPNMNSPSNYAGSLIGGVNTASNLRGDDMKTRQVLARHLYVLMMLLADHTPQSALGAGTIGEFVVQFDANGNGKPTTYPIDLSSASAADANEARADTAAYFAQWAVNIVDFFDSDSIMTPFEYDVYPFRDDDAAVAGRTSPGDTWDVDGIIAPASGSPASVDDAYDVNGGSTGSFGVPFRGLVWGCERPELVITETIATHDRRTVDTKMDSTSQPVDRGSSPQDDDFDQVRRPQGSLIVELFNPNPPFTIGNKIAGQKPSELYTNAAADNVTGAVQFGVDLGRISYTDTSYSSMNGSPVWRLATQQLGQTIPLQKPRLPTLPAAKIDRVVYFVPPSGSYVIASEGYRVFYRNVTGTASAFQPVVPPNHYALVGPGDIDPYPASGLGATGNPLVIHLGGRDKSGDKDTSGTPVIYTSPIATPIASPESRYYRSIFFKNPGDVAIWNTSTKTAVAPYDNLTGYQTNLKPAVAIPIQDIALNAAYAPVNIPLNTAARSVRMSISEPDGGYEVWGSTGAGGAAAAGQVLGGSTYVGNDNAYYNQAAGSKIPDKPYDEDPANFGKIPLNSTCDNLRQTLIAGVSSDTTQATPQTVVYLQRLANPLLPWEANTNPYIIVDQMQVDLTSYNSEKGPAPANMINAEFKNMAASSWFFDTRRRSAGSTTGVQNNVYYQATTSPNGVPFNNLVPGSNNVIITNPMPNSTLGYLNNEYGSYPSNKYTATSAPMGSSTVAQAEYRGDVIGGFPWLNWNDRPFVSAKELMLVPTSSPSTLFAEITTPTSGNWGGASAWAGGPTAPFEPTAQNGQPPYLSGEFSHLANVFQSPATQPSLTARAVARQEMSPNFYRLFEYIHVPSRFSGTETVLPPGKMAGNYVDPNASTNNPKNLPGHALHPPFNRVSQFRDPGRVNINTVMDPFVWQGVIDDPYTAMQGSPLWRNLWRAICQSRLGAVAYNSGGTYVAPLETVRSAYPRADLPTMITSATTGNYMSPLLPSIFGAPFRSYAGRALVPIDAMRREIQTPTPTPPTYSPEREVDATIFRSSPPMAVPAATVSYPLFEYPGSTAPGPYNWIETSVAVDDQYRNPYFAYKAMRRLDNLLTTRSNVYAVWITLGYFEVSPAPSNDPQRAVKYPDGWVLGQEVGADTGDIKRHRAFYMYDRSIPVGFERGENHNVQKGILLERFIE